MYPVGYGEFDVHLYSGDELKIAIELKENQIFVSIPTQE